MSARAFDDRIGAQASGGVEDARFHVVRGSVDGQVGIAAFLCQLQTAGQDVHGDDLRGAEQARALHGAQAHRPGPQYGHAVAGADGGQFRTEVAAGQHVAHQQHVLIGQGIRDGIEPVVRKGHAHVFRLAAVDAATQLPAAVAAVVDVALTAEPAGAAKGLHIGGHTLAGAHFAHLAARCHHFAHEFVPQHRAGQGTRHRAVADMQVTGADAGKFHFDDGITRIPYLRQGTFFQPQVVGTVIDQCMHGFSHKPSLCGHAAVISVHYGGLWAVCKAFPPGLSGGLLVARAVLQHQGLRMDTGRSSSVEQKHSRQKARRSSSRRGTRSGTSTARSRPDMVVWLRAQPGCGNCGKMGLSRH